MPSKLDQVADAAAGGAELHRLAGHYEFPAFVRTEKTAKVLQPEGLASSAYADPVRRQFPCHTKASTWLSALFYQEKRAEFHPKDRQLIAERLTKFAKYWSLVREVGAITARHAELYKQADLPDSAYAYVWVGDDGAKDRRLPLRSAVEVKAAAEWLTAYQDRIGLADRRAIAGRVLEKAAAFGAALGDLREALERQAGRGVCSPAEAVTALRERATLTKASAAVSEHYAALARAVAERPQQALLPAHLTKLAELVDGLDRACGLAGRYGATVPRPEEVFFATTFSKAAAAVQEHVATPTGAVYAKAEFSKLALEDLRALFGDEFAARVGTPLGDTDPEKLAAEARALPAPDCQMLEGLLRDNGVAPALRKAASVRRGPGPDQLRAWAAAYRPPAV